jgi:tetratricopeptide (TPR) repeat protein
LHRASGELPQAEACHRQALELARAIASARHEASALAGLGRCAIATGQPAQAEALMRQAHEIFQQIGTADADAVLAELSALTRRRSASGGTGDERGSGAWSGLGHVVDLLEPAQDARDLTGVNDTDPLGGPGERDVQVT